MMLFNVAAKGLERFYGEWEPSFVVSSSDFWPLEHAVFAEARRAGIPSFVIQHGVTDRFWWPFVADKLLLWGKPFEDELLRLGAPAERLEICGMPAADYLFSTCREKVVSQSSMPARTYVVLSSTHDQVHYPDVFLRYRAFFKAVVTARPATKWLIKLHPNEDESFYRDMLDGQFPNLNILPKSTPLESALSQADVACTLWSTAGLEAMMMRRPLVVFDVAPVTHEYAWWPERGGGVYISSVETMLGFIDKASVDAEFLGSIVKAQNDFLTGSFANPGRAAEAILECMSNSSRIRSLQNNLGPARDLEK
jgi:hypothetical protein